MAKPRGFACLTPERRKEVASSGGKAAQALGVGYRWTPEQAAAAGRIGGTTPRKKKQKAKKQ